MSVNLEQLRIEWSTLTKTVGDDRVSALAEQTTNELLSRVKEYGSQVADVRMRGELQDLAREIADHIFKTTGEFPSAAIAPLPLPSPAFRADISRIIKYGPEQLIGREEEFKLLTGAWDQAVRGETGRAHILTFVALGGEGKTSLVAKWVAELAHQDWPGCEAVFAWSFYSQGTREQTAVSSDAFLAEALNFFGDQVMASSSRGAFDKGRRLAQLVGEQRALLILDGLEPLQYAPTSPTPGELKDAGIAALLKGLAATSYGLCVVTTRYALSDLRAYWHTSAPMHELPRLSTAAGVTLLQSIGVKGSLRKNILSADGLENEFERLVEDVNGHALTLQIIGQFLVRAFHGDIRRYDRIDLKKADAKIQGGHAFRAIEANLKWLEDDSDEARREVALLKLLGLFDRPATADSVAALKQGPAIPGLTEPLVGLADDDWEFSLTSLRNAKLVTVNREEGYGALIALDAHPLLREYFAERLRQQQPQAWRAAHRRIYEHLCATTEEGDQPTLDDLQPLYQAVVHGCQAEMWQEACDKVYYARILRGTQNYSINKLGAFSADLGAVACFFDTPWSRVSSKLTQANQAWLLNQAAFLLRALGRLTEALEPMRVSAEMDIKVKKWQGAAISYSNLSELELTLGEVAGAVGDAEQSMTYANRSGDAFQRMSKRATYAEALRQAGRRAEAEVSFREAEHMQAKSQPDYTLLYSLTGFRYCDLLLTEPERAAWQTILKLETRNLEVQNAVAACRTVSERAVLTLNWAEKANLSPLTISLDHLTLGRATLYATILEGSGGAPKRDRDKIQWQDAASYWDAAVVGLRRAGMQDYVPHGLLTRAWLRHLTGPNTGPESAQEDLDEAWEIAERGPMRLHLADIHLYRARLFHGVKPYPWATDADGKARGPKDDLAAARKLIEECGYWRRKEELEDAEEAAKNW